MFHQFYLSCGFRLFFNFTASIVLKNQLYFQLNILKTTGYEVAGMLGMEITKEFEIGLAHAILFDTKLARISPLVL